MRSASIIAFGSAVSILFTTFTFAQAPQVLSTVPERNELNVTTSTNIAVTFDSDMNPGTFNDSTFVVNSLSTGLHSGAITYDSLSKTATLDPLVDFVPGELVTVVLTDEIESGGVPMDNPYAWSFITAISGVCCRH